MKKVLALLSAISLLTLSACGENEGKGKSVILETVAVTERSEAETEKNEIETTENMEDEIQQAVQIQECTVGNVTFSVPSDWEEISGYEGSFISSSKKCAYQLQGESNLGSFTPDEFFEYLINYYKDTDHEIISSDAQLSDIRTVDGSEAKVGNIKMTKNNVVFSTDVLLVPQKNKAITFALQTADEKYIETNIREITKTAKINVGNEDYIKGNTFIASDSSKLCLNDDMTFKYYQSKDSEDVYCDGKYECYYGQAAIDKVASMTEYGITEEELEQTMSENLNGYVPGGSSPLDFISDETVSGENTYHVCKDTFYAVILHNENLVDNGNTSPMGNDTLYIGYYLTETDNADMVNAVTSSYVSWALE